MRCGFSRHQAMVNLSGPRVIIDEARIADHVNWRKEERKLQKGLCHERGPLAGRCYQPLLGRAATGSRLCIKIRKLAPGKCGPDKCGPDST